MIFGGIFDVDHKRERLVEVQRELEDPAIWNNPEKAQNLGKERAQLEAVVVNIKLIENALKDSAELFDLAAEENDIATVDSVIQELDKATKKIEQLEFQRMFAGEMDANSAFMDSTIRIRRYRSSRLGKYVIAYVFALG